MAVRSLRTMMHSLDAWLWRRGVRHPVIRPLVRNEVLLTALSLLCGGIVFSITPWFLWFGVGLGIMALTFWSLARFFLRTGLGEYSAAFLRVVLLRWGGRLLLFAGLLYLALAVWQAPVTAILGGLTAGAVTALLTFAVVSREAGGATGRG